MAKRSIERILKASVVRHCLDMIESYTLTDCNALQRYMHAMQCMQRCAVISAQYVVVHAQSKAHGHVNAEYVTLTGSSNLIFTGNHELYEVELRRIIDWNKFAFSYSVVISNGWIKKCNAMWTKNLFMRTP